MARIRTIKPDFFRHAELYEAERESNLPLRIGFAGLWTAADRDGRFKWRPRELKLDCLPHDDVDFSRVLDALATRGWIVRYVVDGVHYGAIPSWHSHQVINNREKPSDLPAPNENNMLTRAPRVDDACPTRLKYAQGEGKGKGREEDGGGEERAPIGQSGADQTSAPADSSPDNRAPGKSLISEEAFVVAAEVLQAMGYDQNHPLSVGAPLTVQGWFNAGWHRDCILAGVRRGMQSRGRDPPSTLKYFERAIARAHAELTPAIPTIDASDAQTAFARSTTPRSRGSGYAIIAARLGAHEPDD